MRFANLRSSQQTDNWSGLSSGIQSEQKSAWKCYGRAAPGQSHGTFPQPEHRQRQRKERLCGQQGIGDGDVKPFNRKQSQPKTSKRHDGDREREPPFQAAASQRFQPALNLLVWPRPRPAFRQSRRPSAERSPAKQASYSRPILAMITETPMQRMERRPRTSPVGALCWTFTADAGQHRG